MPRDSGRSVRTSDSKRSCSSPPPTSTAPTSVSSQSSPGRPFVSVSTHTYSAREMVTAAGSIEPPIGPRAPDSLGGCVQRGTYVPHLTFRAK